MTILSRLRDLLAISAMACSIAAAGAAFGQEHIMRDQMIRSADYDQFVVTEPDGARSCAAACVKDQRCRAWTFVRPVSECRLKQNAGPVMENTCCVSGLKQGVAAGAGGTPGTLNRRTACDHFARVGVVQAETARQAKCGVPVDDPRWSLDVETQRRACLADPEQALSSGIAEREGVLAACLKPADQPQQLQTQSDPDCDGYAKRAVHMADINRGRRCGADGEGWSTDYRVHQQFCLSSSPQERRIRMMERLRALSACAADHGFSLELGF